jgi:hypothetical protein
MFEINTLRRIFGPKQEEIRGWRILHNEGLHNLYSVSYLIRMIRSRKIRWARHTRRVREMKNTYTILI